MHYKLNLNNISNDFGLTILHQSIILDIINLYTELLENKVKINIPDFYGNTALHYIFLEKREKYLSYIRHKIFPWSCIRLRIYPSAKASQVELA